MNMQDRPLLSERDKQGLSEVILKIRNDVLFLAVHSGDVDPEILEEIQGNIFVGLKQVR